MIEVDFWWNAIVDCDYDSHYPCHNGSDCCDNDMCRCGQITNIRITKKDYLGVFDMIVADGKNKEFNKILAFMLLKNLIRDAEFDAPVSGGYYGEEIGSVKPENEQEIKNLLAQFNSLSTSPDEQLLLVLGKEYGYVLPRLKLLKGWSYKRIPLGEVKFTEEVLMRTSNDIVSRYENFIFESDRKDDPHFPGIICDESNKIIDGYHRLAACKRNLDDKKLISIISPEKA